VAPPEAEGPRTGPGPGAVEPPALDELARTGGTYVSPVDRARMVLVPGGEFFQGRDAKDIFAPDPERPGRTVLLRPFLVDVEPVTNARFRAFIEAGGYRDRTCWSAAGWAWRVHGSIEAPLSLASAGFDAPEQPAAGVSWYEAEAYARFAGKRLPTEAQWEKAARGVDRRRFPWGDALPLSRVCNFNNNVGRTTPPGRYPEGSSPYGCLDMAGNVNNWCRDWYFPGFYGWCAEQGVNEDPVLDDALRARLGLDLKERADRGGGFATSFSCWEVLTTTGRLAWPPARRNLWNGFRCVIEL